jgi:DNA-binding NtrC family response regulator
MEALREGAFDYIRKPIDLDLLIQILQRAKEEAV